MSIERIIPAGGASPRGHYTPAMRAGDFVYVSGQGPIDPVTDKLAAGDVAFQTQLTLSNMQRILEAAAGGDNSLGHGLCDGKLRPPSARKF